MDAYNEAGNTPVIVLLLTILTMMLPSLWKTQVAVVVPEPYLDEVFHARQAQAYCAEQFHIWDPKITTPPGLYFLAWGWNKLFGCDIDKLRFLNAILLGFLFTQILFSRDIIDLIQQGKPLKSSQSMENFSFQDWFKAFNIITFPPLFFFSALFYTDVASTIIVYLFFQLFLDRLMSKQENQRKEIIQVVLGIGALLFRQTNVFWVAIFPAGLAIIQGTKAIARDRRLPKDGPQSFIEVVQQAWNDSIVYDPPVAEAWLDDYIKAGLSISIVATLNIGKIIPSLYPSLMLLNVFAAFVVWNGGVVLGDKSNHIATIHTPQMLYIWLYMLFFSWPLTLPTISKILQGFLSPPPFTLILRRLAIFALWTALALAAVHFNTIIHPFTLADNRHYTFYVFKLLRQNPILFYLLTPVYVISAYIIIQTLGAAPSKQPAAETPSLSASAKPSDNAPKPSQPAEALAWLCPSGARTSYILVWTLTTALTLVSAPLVEPRYAILPWLFWRIHVPSISTSALLPESVKKKVESRPPGRMMAGADARMRVEMVWHVAVNVVTAYLFLYQGFSWSGKEWEGQVMRFMW